jgi:hypothetical protein
MDRLSRNRITALVLACALVMSSTVWAAEAAAGAQTTARAEEQRRIGMIKILGGLASAGLGAMFIAASHESASGEVLGQRINVSATNMGGMIAGVGMLGAGGYLVYLGMKDRRDAQSSPSIAVSVGRRTGVFVTKRW